MNYLYDYLKVLQPAERERLPELELPRRQREVLDAIDHAARTGDENRDRLLHTLAISSTNFDKTCSVLLKRLMESFSGTGTALLADLKDRWLNRLLLHELAKQEKEMQDRTEDERQKFYRFAMNLLDGLGDAALMNPEVAEKFDRFISRSGIEETDALRTLILTYHEIQHGMRLGGYEELQERVEAKLPMLRECAESGDPLHRYYAHRSLSRYHSLLAVDMERRIEHLREMLAIANDHPDRFSERDRVLIDASIAESEYYHDNLTGALNRYRRIFAEHEEILRKDVYHILKVGQIGMILGEYDYAITMIRRWFGDPPYAMPSPTLIDALVCLADNRPEEAYEHIRNGYETNEQNVIYEAHLRILETFYFTLRGDHDFVGDLVEKHVKYLRSHGMGVKQSNFPRILNLIRAIVTERQTGKPISKRYMEYYEHLQFGARRQYGVLLEKLRRE